MAKTIKGCRLCVHSASDQYNESIYFEYSVTDGDLSKITNWEVSGIDLEQPISGIWDDIVSQVKSDEGIV